MIQYLPTVNALLNLSSLLFLLIGRIAITRRMLDLHKKAMLIAFFFSVAFFVSYLIYHYSADQMTTFKGAGNIRVIYYFILFTHIPLAIVVVPAAITALFFALQQKFLQHKKIVRWLWPMWVYVSLTGVLIYLMLYHLYPGN